MTGEADQNVPADADGDKAAEPAADARWSRRARRTVAISQAVVAVAQAIDVVVKIFT